jgi:hypothetical protein
MNDPQPNFLSPSLSSIKISIVKKLPVKRRRKMDGIEIKKGMNWGWPSLQFPSHPYTISRDDSISIHPCPFYNPVLLFVSEKFPVMKIKNNLYFISLYYTLLIMRSHNLKSHVKGSSGYTF